MKLLPQQSFPKWRDYPIWFRVVGVAMIVNFAAYWLIAAGYGGEARTGHIKDGRYFLGCHGSYTEVSRSVWSYSYYHGRSIWITHGAFFVGIAILLNTKRKRRNAEPSDEPNADTTPRRLS